MWFRACLHEGGGPQVGEVTCGGLPHLSRKRDHIKMRDYMDSRVTPPKRVTSSIWGTPPPCKQALKYSLCSNNCFFSLLPAIFFELPITRTFFDFPWRFELSGVAFNKIADTVATMSQWFSGNFWQSVELATIARRPLLWDTWNN